MGYYGMDDSVRCCCGRGYYDPETYNCCYSCYVDRRSRLIRCILCGRRHSPEYNTCYTCRSIPGRDEAATNLRIDILLRDDCRCRICGSTAQPEVDHIKPCAKGGTAVPWNLQILCHTCNHNKGVSWKLGRGADQARITLIHLYLTFGWHWLTEPERDQLITDAHEISDKGWRPTEFIHHSRYCTQVSLAGSAEMQAIADAADAEVPW
ncbi:HNH endonuclease [Mycobacterium sp. NPDC051198]